MNAFEDFELEPVNGVLRIGLPAFGFRLLNQIKRHQHNTRVLKCLSDNGCECGPRGVSIHE